ncbi:hypothetical protein CS063_01655 [Sporanaerobium hydrogeniformans]|uniref:Uncharacterized protein n=1 Tax=Sporanaerobium hydrogeniformans TaxID=3072179 RepID=A0AC61DHV7_9FIRM|nr:hypothetical protein [Sporanaerobium hydrogeniformans]PHV72206.1 hypothetical protein CS063_01655 [Sporanaerobium hydrogeniformans]
MRIEVYIPDREIEVIQKILELKENKKLSSYIVDLLKREEENITEEKVIELIKKYTPEHKNTAMRGGLEDSVQSILKGL